MPTRPPVHRPLGWQPSAIVKIERQRRNDRERGTPAERGYDADWIALRKRMLRFYPKCQVPGCHSTVRLNVHHIQSIRVNPARRLDATNLMVLCHAHHSQVTAKQDGGFGHRPRPPGLGG